LEGGEYLVHESLIYVKRSTPNRLIYKKSRRHAKNIITEVEVANTQFICGSIHGALLNFRKKMVLVFLLSAYLAILKVGDYWEQIVEF